MALKRTVDQVHRAQSGYIGTKGRPNPWWGLGDRPRPTNDCLGFQLWTLGVRDRADYAPKHVSISAFRKAYGWHEIDLIEDGFEHLQFGDLIGEEWPGTDKHGNAHPFTGIPGHIERFVSWDRTGNTITTQSANTGPIPGRAVPNGMWQKTRTVTDRRNWVIAIRPPYKGDADTAPYGTKEPTGLNGRSKIKTVARYLNDHIKTPHTQADKDGVTGPNYWTLVQKWGREHGLYGSTYKIDGIPGPRTRQIEAVILTRAVKKK